MLTESKKLILIICLPLTLLLSSLACVASADPNRESIKGLDITLQVNQLDELRVQLGKFADKHSLEFIDHPHNRANTFIAGEIIGEDFHIVLNNTTNSPDVVGIALFNKVTPPISQKSIDELFDDLKTFINEIPNVVITERVKALIIRIDETQRKMTFAEISTQMQQLADKHSLEYKVLAYDSSLETFLVEMQGEGFRITVEAVRSPGKIGLIFYIDFDNNVIPTLAPTPQETLNELINDLKSSLIQIPNVTITEQP